MNFDLFMKYKIFAYLVIGSLILTLEGLIIVSTIYSLRTDGKSVPEFETIFIIFGNIITSVITWFFTKKHTINNNKQKEIDEAEEN